MPLAVDKALAIFIAVGTPPKSDGSADLSYVEEVGRGIAKNMTGYKVIVTKSTVPVGTGEKLREVMRERTHSRVDALFRLRRRAIRAVLTWRHHHAIRH